MAGQLRHVCQATVRGWECYSWRFRNRVEGEASWLLLHIQAGENGLLDGKMDRKMCLQSIDHDEEEIKGLDGKGNMRRIFYASDSFFFYLNAELQPISTKYSETNL